MIDKNLVFVKQHSIVSFQMLIDFLEFLDLEKANLILLSFFALVTNIFCHELDCLLAETEITLKHSLLGKVFRLEIAE